jgi:hypothetical protein
MAQIFHRSTNTLSKVSIFGAVFILAGLGGIASLLIRSGFYTQIYVAREQPVPFSHKHHVGGLGIDCRFCHTSVETSSFAGIPPTKTCMGCHSQIWADSPTLEPVRASFRTDRSIEWNRVHKVADFVYFNHSIHINKGVGCATCHGRVDQMPLMRREHTLLMEWCIGCHQAPEQNLRPRAEVFNMAYEPPASDSPVVVGGQRYTDQATLCAALMKEYKVQKLTDCSTCHR